MHRCFQVDHAGVDAAGVDTYNTLYIFPAGRHDAAVKCEAVRYPIKVIGSDNYVHAIMDCLEKHGGAALQTRDEL